MSTKILALSIECQSWLSPDLYGSQFTVNQTNLYNSIAIKIKWFFFFLKYWNGLHSCWILNSTQWIRDSRITHFSFLFTVTKGKLISSCGIPDSLSYILDSKVQDSGFHKQNFPRFRIPTRQKRESTISASRFPHVCDRCLFIQ